MTIRRVGILGGGPAGLYAARLLKLRQPSLEVIVYERNDPSATFGFGVALTGVTQRNLATADRPSWEAIRAVGIPLDTQEFRLPDGRASIRGGQSLGIGRATLLGVLFAHAEQAGAAVEIGERAPDDVDGDVLLACDGVNSAARTQLAGEFGARVEVGRELYLWCGTDFALPNVFIPVTTEHGTFVAHAYAYAPDRSTVLIETDEATWRAAGFDLTTASLERDRSAASDDASLEYLTEAFAPHLNGHRLLGNRTRWLRFNSVSCARWHHGRTVLLGDAAHTAHYSLGSGAKLAMEDAITLSQCLVESDDTEVCFATYEAARRPAVARIQSLARRSQLWWESFPRRAQLSPAQTAVAYMTRAGNVSLEQLAETNSDLVASALASYSRNGPPPASTEDPVAEVLEQPLAWKARRLPTRVLTPPLPADYREVTPATPEALRAVPGIVALSVDVADAWGPEGDAVVEMVRGLLAGGADGVRLTDGDDRHALLDRLALAERLRLETGALVLVEGPEDLQADLAAGLISGRCDLVALTPLPVDLRAAPTDGQRPPAAATLAPPYRIGLVVPSSNVTVETEMPALLARHADARFSFHASRMRMLEVSAAELAAMNAQAARCVDELADAAVDALLYGCLVAVMAQGHGEHRRVEAAVTSQLQQRPRPTQVASSAGALVEALEALGASTIALVTPYMRPLAEKVVAYLEDEGVKVADWRTLEVPDNAAVGRIPGERVMSAARSLDLTAADALVISACVQMPSLDLVQSAEDTFGLPVLSAATAAAYVLLRRLGLPPVLPGAGSLLAGGVPALAVAKEAR
jgi:anthraniloyl-CoA monooxygenase